MKMEAKLAVVLMFIAFLMIFGAIAFGRVRESFRYWPMLITGAVLVGVALWVDSRKYLNAN